MNCGRTVREYVNVNLLLNYPGRRLPLQVMRNRGGGGRSIIGGLIFIYSCSASLIFFYISFFYSL